ncbi:MAG TPA: PIN domain-containing protein [Candidatus Sulfotelmatobacter sp.]|nr:PIN domain-containing protein [Candidatus Sulfotelmatobacter sp.]
MRYLLDSTFLIDYLRGDRTARARFRRLFEDGDEPVVNEIVVCEVATGAAGHPDPDLVALLEPIEFVQPGAVAPLLAGQWRGDARRRGHQLSLADALIAVAAHGADAAVLTRNVRDFAHLPVQVETY